MNRRDFLVTSGAGTLLTGAIWLPGFRNEIQAGKNDETSKTSPGISPDMDWQRRDEPVLSSTTTRVDWCKTYCYSPHVIRTSDGYRMYYIGRTGSSSELKSLMGFVVGMATSDDGLHWKPYGETPVLTFDNVPWGAFALQTPYVMWDEEEQLFKLWFIGITEWVRNSDGGTTEITQRLGYATSEDGIRWNVHPEPIFDSGRRPCVHKEGSGAYRMWMNSRPSRQEPWGSLYQNVYEFRSKDGIRWNRSDEPVLRQSDKHGQGSIYPFVCRDASRYFLWYGAYPKRESGIFQIYLAESEDGTNWLNHDSKSAFPIADDRNRFDSFYVSTPCVLVEPDRYLLYYSAVSWAQREKGSYYQHIGVAVCPRGR
jgi:predicted GH43/DUF377 family glycosyl hydrolase